VSELRWLKHEDLGVIQQHPASAVSQQVRCGWIPLEPDEVEAQEQVLADERRREEDLRKSLSGTSDDVPESTDDAEAPVAEAALSVEKSQDPRPARRDSKADEPATAPGSTDKEA
jgi:hypothetical protein